MIALYASVAAASLIGSLHCAAMCGPLQALYLDPTHRGGARLAAALAHAGGRLAAYATLGAIAGGLGAVVDVAGRLATVQRAAMVIAGLAVIAWGALALAAALGVAVPRLRPRAWPGALVQLGRRRPAARAALYGVLTGALPCGWLWAFVVLAAGTGSIAGGAAVMATFWLGTVPMMVGLGALTGALVRHIGPRLPLVTAAVLIGLGVTVLAARVPLLDTGVADLAGSPPTEPACHRGSP